MSDSDPKDVMKSPTVLKYLAAIDEATNVALKEHKSTLSSMGSDYSSTYTNEYKKDANALEGAQDDFNAAANALTLGKEKDAKKAIAAYRRFVLTLAVLEEQNIRFGAYIESDFAQQCAKMILVSIAVLTKARKDFESLQKEVLELQKMVKQAQKQFTEAQVQLVFNLVLDGISVLLPEFKLATSLGGCCSSIGRFGADRCRAGAEQTGTGRGSCQHAGRRDNGEREHAKEHGQTNHGADLTGDTEDGR
jgi:hypothetical protein